MKNIYTFTFVVMQILASASYANSQCFDDGHSPFQEQGWLSCNTSVGPIPERGDAHWILYDFGHIYTLDSLYFWNHNVWGETGMGVKSILIDYSTDKEDWNTVGPIQVNRAPGSWKYTGTQGPSLNNVDARYVLVTVISTWREASSCAGLAEIKFGVSNSVDVSEEVWVSEWSIAPNPATDKITVSLPAVNEIQDISIYNSVGQMIRRMYPDHISTLNIVIDDLKQGLYFVSISTGKEVLTKSFVKS